MTQTGRRRNPGSAKSVLVAVLVSCLADVVADSAVRSQSRFSATPSTSPALPRLPRHGLRMTKLRTWTGQVESNHGRHAGSGFTLSGQTVPPIFGPAYNAAGDVVSQCDVQPSTELNARPEAVVGNTRCQRRARRRHRLEPPLERRPPRPTAESTTGPTGPGDQPAA